MTNSATQLHGLLQQVRAQGTAIGPAWSTVLGAEWDSPDFARRHGEVLRLLAETVDAIACLGDSSTKRRMETYVPRWWTAVMSPRADWLSGHSPSGGVISDSDLDHLASAADILEARLGGTPMAPQVDVLESLATQCSLWETLIPEATELPQALRLALLGHVHHLSWLVANVDVFGPARATQEAHALFGEITVATARVKRSRLPQWRDSLASMFAVLVFLNGLSDGTTDLLEAASDTVNAVTHLITATTDAVTTDAEQGPGQIEAPDREPKTPRDQA